MGIELKVHSPAQDGVLLSRQTLFCFLLQSIPRDSGEPRYLGRALPKAIRATFRFRADVQPALLSHPWPFPLPGGSVVKNLPAKQETCIASLGQEDPLEEAVATHSSIAWRIPWTEEPEG